MQKSEVDRIADLLQAAVQDPMWANHAEVSKAALMRAVHYLQQVPVLQACLFQMQEAAKSQAKPNAPTPVAQPDGEPASRQPLHRECAMFPPEERCGECGPLSPAVPAPVVQPLTTAQKHAILIEWGDRKGTRTLFELIEMVERAHGIEATGQEGGAA